MIQERTAVKALAQRDATIAAQMLRIQELTFRIIELRSALQAFAAPWDEGRKFGDMSVEEIDELRAQARDAIGNLPTVLQTHLEAA